MNTSKLGEWLQIAVSLSVLAGVVLVAWELRQNNTLSALERLSEVNQLWNGVYQFEYENDVKLLYRKTVEAPQDLTDAEILKYDIWMTMVMDLMVLNDVQNKSHGLQNTPTDLADLYVDFYFTGEYSRQWFEANKEWYMDSPDLVGALQEEIDRRPVSSVYGLLESLRPRN